MSGLSSEVEKRKALADHYYDNYRKYLERGDRGKASEFIWGAIENLAYALGLLDGQKLGDHGKVRKYLAELATSLEDSQIPEGIIASEHIHANFYHDYMDKDLFDYDRVKAEALAEKLAKILMDRLRSREEQG